MTALSPEHVESPAEAPAAADKYTRCRTTTECPICFSPTQRAASCPVCHTDLSDAAIEEAERSIDARRRRQVQVVGYLTVGTVCLVLGLTGGHALGARSVAVAAHRRLVAAQADLQAQAQASADQERYVLRSLRPESRFDFHRTNLQSLFRRDILPIVNISFTPIEIPGQPTATDTPDLTLTVASAAGWASHLPDERQMILTTYSELHEHFLSQVGYSDTVHFAVRIATLTPQGRTQTLALRDRGGRLYVGTEVASGQGSP